MRHRLLAAATACLALTACGSTAQVTSRSAAGDALGGSGSSLGSQQSPDSAGAGTSDTAARSTTTTGAAAAGSSAVATGRTGGRPVTTLGPSTTGPAKKAPVEVGVIFFPDVNATFKSFGSSADIGDQKAQTQTAIDWVNGHGGLAGHRIAPVYFEFSLASTQSYSTTYQAVCSTFTQDHHVVAVILVGNADVGFPACLNKKNALLVANGHYMHTLGDYRSLPNLVTPNEVSSDRVASILAREILDRRLVKAGDTLGLLVMDYAAPQRARDSYILPAMKAAGVRVISYTIPYPQSTQDLSSTVSATQSAQLAMAAAGVKNVAFMCPGCVQFFMQNAESQQYYPRYIQTSLDTVGALYGKGHGKSLANSFTLGWDPTRDAGTYDKPGLLGGNATYALCRKIERGNYSQNPSLFSAVAYCSGVMDLYAAAAANPVAVLTGPSLMTGFSALGSTHAGGANFATSLSASKHDGTSAYRTMHYDADCDCLLYDDAVDHAFSG